MGKTKRSHSTRHYRREKAIRDYYQQLLSTDTNELEESNQQNNQNSIDQMDDDLNGYLNSPVIQDSQTNSLTIQSSFISSDYRSSESIQEYQSNEIIQDLQTNDTANSVNDTNSLRLPDLLESFLSNNLNDQILNNLLILQQKSNLQNQVLDGFLKIIQIIIKNRDYKFDIPKSFHLFKKHFDLKLKRYYGFVSSCCKKEVTQERLNGQQFYCYNCSTNINCLDIFSQREYFIHLDLKQIIKLLLSRYSVIEPIFDDNKINTIFDTQVFKELYHQKGGKLLVLTTFIDGAPLPKSSDDKIWPIFIRINNLNCNENSRTFLSSCLTTQSQPNPNFYLNHIVNQLIDLFYNGIEINDEIYYVSLFNQVYDTPARDSFLINNFFNSLFGCTVCLNSGVRIGSVHIYLPDKNFLRRTKEVYSDAFKVLDENEHFESFLGIKDRSVLHDLPYYDVSKSTTVELMHALGLGTVKRLMRFQTSFQNRRSKSYINDQNTFNKRLSKFIINSDFKRNVSSSSKISKWKANQCIDYFFYVSLICLRTLISKEAYHHYFQLVFCIAKLWNYGLDNEQIEFIKNQIDQFLEDVRELYSINEYVINMHSNCHLVDNYKETGALGENTTFLSEHRIGKLVKGVNSAYLHLEQILNNYNLNFCCDLILGNSIHKYSTIGNSFRFQNRDCFRQVKIGSRKITSILIREKKNLKNCFVETNSNRFFIVQYFFKLNNNLYFEGQEISVISKLSSTKNGTKLELDHIYKGKVTQNYFVFKLTDILGNIVFGNRFRQNSSRIFRDGTGYIIRSHLFKFHN
jgi:hypothetical protein